MSESTVDALNEQDENISALQKCVKAELAKYFETIDNITDSHDLYKIVVSEVEIALFQFLLKKTKGNQSLASKILGINRNTLRKKLSQLNI